MIVPDLKFLNGQSVLVKSATDHRDPPIGMRGTIEVRPDGLGRPSARIVLEFPDMCNEAAHQRSIALDPTAIEHLLATEPAGAFEYTIAGPLDAGPHAEPWEPKVAS